MESILKQKTLRSCYPVVTGILLIVVFFGSFAFFLTTYRFADIASLHVPHRHFVIEALESGIIQLWNPLIQMGFPLHAESEIGIFYPFNFLLFMSSLSANDTINVSILLHTFLAFWGMLLCGRKLHFTPNARIFIAVAYGFCGYAVVHTMQLNMGPGIALLPWMLFSVLLLMERPHSMKGQLLLAGCTGLLFLGSHPQISFYNLQFIVMMIVMIGIVNVKKEGLKHQRSLIVSIITSISLGLMLGAVQILPTLELIPHSLRDQGMSQLMGSMSLRELCSFIVPTLWRGTPFGEGLRARFFTDFYHEHSNYLGLLPLVFAYLSFMTKPKGDTNRGIYYCLLVIFIISIFLSFGDKSIVFPLLRQVPFLARFSTPARILLLSGFCLILISGYGFSRMERGQLQIHKWLFSATIVLGLCGVARLFYIWHEISSLFDTAKITKIAFSGGFLITQIILLFIVFIFQKRKLFFILPFVLFVDLFFFLSAYNPRIDRVECADYNPMATCINSLEGRGRIHSFYTLSFSVPKESLLLPDSHVLYNIAGIDTFFSLSLRNNKIAFRELEQNITRCKNEIIVHDIEPFLKLGITHLLSEDPLIAPNIHEIFSYDGIRLYTIAEEANLATVQTKEGQVLDDVTVQVKRQYNQAQIVFSLPTNHEKVDLIYKDSFFPGWTATQNGVPVEIVQSGLFKSSELTADNFDPISFTYKPFSFRLGLFVSLIGTMLFLIRLFMWK